MSALLFKTHTSLQLVMGQVSVCAALEGPFQGTSDRQRQKSPSPLQRTSYATAERFRKYYNFLFARAKNPGLKVEVCRERLKSRNSCLARNPSVWV